jgi:hypothetical protein
MMTYSEAAALRILLLIEEDEQGFVATFSAATQWKLPALWRKLQRIVFP